MHAHAQVMHKLSACASKLALVLGDECAASSRRLLAASDSAFFLGESTILAGRAARTRTSSARQASGLSFRRLEGDDEAPLVGQELSRCTERESAERPSRTTCNTESSLEPAKPLQRTATNSCSELLGAGAATSRLGGVVAGHVAELRADVGAPGSGAPAREVRADAPAAPPARAVLLVLGFITGRCTCTYLL